MIRRLLLALLAAGALRAGTEIRSYQVRLRLQPDGSALAAATLELVDAGPGALLIPLGFSKVEGLAPAEGLPGATLVLGPTNGQALIHATLPAGTPAACRLGFTFRVPRAFVNTTPQPGEKPTLAAGNRLFRHTFVQTQETVVEAYRLEVILPEGMVVQGVREALPKPKKTEVLPRVRLDRLEGRQAAILQLDQLQQGDDTTALLELTPARKSWGWLIAGLALAALYLYHFRDIVLSPTAATPKP